MLWACFLHFYQPPTQKKYWIDRVTNECYRRVVQGLLGQPQAKITLNINSVLCELWDEYGHHDVLSGLKTLIERGQVELTGSAKYHPLLPKLPKEMVIRQIVLNEVTLNKYFGVVGPVLGNCKSEILNSNSGGVDPALGEIQRSLLREDPTLLESGPNVSNLEPPTTEKTLKGFFPPEMAYDRYLATIVSDLGYRWIISEELSLGRAVSYDRIYTVSGVNVKESPLQVCQELKIFFRDRAFSYKVLAGYLGTEKLFLDELEEKFPEGSKDHFLLTAMDGETFGHHRPGMERLLFNLFHIPSIQMVHLTELPELIEARESVKTCPSTWALMEHEVERNLPFARWDDPENEVHRLQWQLTKLAIEAVSSKFNILNSKQVSNDKNPNSLSILNSVFSISDLNAENSDLTDSERVVKAQILLDRALHSDQYWWASAKPWWSIEYIERGAYELLAVVRSCHNSDDPLPLVINEKTGLFKLSPSAPDSRSRLREAWALYINILITCFEYQRSGKVDEISRKEDETIRMRTDQALPKMPKEEITKIIKTINHEMLEVAGRQEYERAAQLRDRIKELEGYLNPKP